jgi:glucokinase
MADIAIRGVSKSAGGVAVGESSVLVAGVDVGGTKTLAVVVDVARPQGVVAQVRRATEVDGVGGVLATVTEVLVQVTAAASASPDALAAVGVGVPGIVDPLTGSLRYAVNLGIGGEMVDLVGALGRHLGDQVVVANDVDLAALGAREVLGTAGDVAYLSIGTGVATGFVIRGQMHPGAHGAAGEIGHLPVAPDGPVCECGQRGCLEAVVSGPAIARRWHALGGDGVGGDVATALFRLAADGDAVAVALRDEVCGHLAAAVALIGQTLDPAQIVLGGGVADVGQPLVEGVREALRRRAGASPLLWALALDERVVLLPNGTPAGALGAALAARTVVTGGGEPPGGGQPEVATS